MKTKTTQQETKAILSLKKAMTNNTAIATDFEQAIKSEGLTMEIIELIMRYYKDDVDSFNVIINPRGEQE